jgi:hypothetical protein
MDASSWIVWDWRGEELIRGPAHAVRLGRLTHRRNRSMTFSTRIVRRAMLAVGSTIVWIACASPAPRSADTGVPRSTGAAEDTIRLGRLEAEARLLARTDGCDAAAACRTAPVGWRGCGGPRTYLIYCPATTDTVALLRKLEELKRAEMEYNERSDVVSTCEMRMPPNVGAQGGRCVASR